MIHDNEFVWNNAERNRRFDVYRPCPCGTCSVCRRGVGYLSFSDDGGNGFTIWLQDEEVFDRLRAALDELRKEHSENQDGLPRGMMNERGFLNLTNDNLGKRGEREESVSPARRKLRSPTMRAKRKAARDSMHKPAVTD